MARKSKGRLSGRATSRVHLAFLALSILIPLAALSLQVARLHPFVDDVNATTSRHDDWLNYKRFASSVVDDGLEMPAVRGNYARPGGILYPYFVALVFSVFGENSAWVYIVQGTLIAIGIVVMAWAFRDRLSEPIALVALMVLAVYCYLDVFRWYSQKLLSENLLYAVIPWFFLALLKARDLQSKSWITVAGVILGLAVLTRPNVLAAGLLILALILIYFRSQPRVAITLATWFLIGFVGGQLPLFVRNVVVTGKVTLGTFSPAFQTTHDWLDRDQHDPIEIQPIDREQRPVYYYVDRTLYTLGVTEYGLVYRWVVMNLLIGVLVVACMKHRSIEFGDAALFAFTISYLGPLILFAAIRTYGVRMVLPIIPIHVVLAFRGLTSIRSLFTRKQEQ